MLKKPVIHLLGVLTAVLTKVISGFHKIFSGIYVQGILASICRTISRNTGPLRNMRTRGEGAAALLIHMDGIS